MKNAKRVWLALLLIIAIVILTLVVLKRNRPTAQSAHGFPPLPPKIKIERPPNMPELQRHNFTYWLNWLYPLSLPQPNLQFMVYESNSFSNWQYLLTTNRPPVRLNANLPAQYFRLLVHDTVTGLYSTNSPVVSGGTTNVIKVAWSPSAATNVSGYRVYYWQTKTNVLSVGAVTNATLTLPIGTNSIGVTAYDSAGLESPLSNIIQWIVGLTVTNYPPAPVSSVNIFRQ